ncbi:MAG: DDE-type integrase/transposase/recombinase [Pseudomonadales bacterium]
MNTKIPPYKRRRYPAAAISDLVWLYHRFSLSFRAGEELLSVRGATVTYEIILQWCIKLPSIYTKKLRNSADQSGDTWYLDEALVRIRDKQHNLWRAVNQDHNEIDILVQQRRSKGALAIMTG